MGIKPLTRVLTAIVFVLSIGLAAFGQGTTSRVTGTVTDSSGAAISGATVTLQNESTGVTLTATTGDRGTYTFDLLPPGNYTVSVEHAGFKKFVSTRNAALVNQPSTVNIALEVGDVSAVVSVEATAEQVQTNTSGNVGSTIDQRAIESLPIVGLRGRNPLDLVDFQPGSSVGANTGGGIHVHGSRDRAFNYTLDGIDINESSAGGSNFTPLRPNPDSIQEFQIITSNFTAELGRSPGAQVTFVTRSGTNDYHGNLFEYHQTPKVNANEFENNLLGVPRRKFIQHIFGGSLGGPLFNPGFGEGTPVFDLLKDRAFFFVNLQFLRAIQSSLTQRIVYTQEARDGLFRYVQGGRNFPAGTATPSVDTSGSPLFPNCGVLTTNCIATYDIANNPSGIGVDPFLTGIIDSTPLPNDFAVGDGLNTAGFNFLAPQEEKQYDFVTRIDFKFSDTNTIYGRYAEGRQETFGDTVNAGSSAFPGTPILVYTDRKPKNLAINHRFSPSANTTNEFIFGWSNFVFDFIAPETDPLANFTFNNIQTINTNVRGNTRDVSTIQFVDNFTYVASNHLLKGGINFRFGKHVDDRSSVASTVIEGEVNFSAGINNDFSAFNLPPTGATGINAANDLALLRNTINNLLGRVGSINQAFVTNAAGTAFEPPGTRWAFEHKYPELDFYFQDSWRFRPNLLFDLGVRYEVKLSPSSSGLPILAPDQLATWDASPSNTLRWEEGKLFENDLNNWSPSVGVAWDPFKNGKTSIRANYRLSFDRLNSQVNGAQLFQSAPGNNIGVSNTSFGQSGGLLRDGLPVLTPTSSPDDLRQPRAFGTGSQTIFDPRARYPEVQSWFVGFQHELFWDNVLEINYIGKRGEHLFGAYNANEADINATATGFNTTFLDEFIAIRNNPAYVSPFINALYTGNSANAAGTSTFRSTLATTIASGNVASAARSVSLRTSGSNQMIAVNGFSPFLFMPFPQFANLIVLETEDYSRYHAFEFNLKRRMKNGLAFQGSYVWSKSKDTRSYDPTFTLAPVVTTAQSGSSTPFRNSDRSLNYAWSDFDRRHVFNLTFVAELPFGRGRKFFSDIPIGLDWLIGGWQLSGLANYSSGRPMTIYSGLFTFSSNVSTPAICSGCPRDLGSVVEESGTSYFFDAAQRGMFTQPEPGEFSETGRNYFIGPPDYRFDTSLSKRFRFTESMNFEIRVDARNVFNMVAYGFPTTSVNSATFGRIRTTIDSSARRIQFSGKFNF